MPKPDDNPGTKRLIEEDTPFLTPIKAIVAAIVVAVSFEAGARTLIPDGTWAKVVVPIISAAGLLTVSFYVITAKKERTTEIVLPQSQRPRLMEYRYARTFRIYCMAGAAALSIILFTRLWQIRPNALTGKIYVSGFVCSAKTGEPIRKGVVEILGQGDMVVSQAPQKLDDRGFFYSKLKRWAFSPTAIRIIGTDCAEIYLIPLEPDRPGACPSRALAPNTEVLTQEWVISCDVK